jgi:hypothetical protein
MAKDAGARAEMALLVFVDLAVSAGAGTTMKPISRTRMDYEAGEWAWGGAEAGEWMMESEDGGWK